MVIYSVFSNLFSCSRPFLIFQKWKLNKLSVSHMFVYPYMCKHGMWFVDPQTHQVIMQVSVIMKWSTATN